MDSILCKHTIQKNSEDSVGVEPRNPPSGYASGFHLVQTTRDPGEQLR